jgi:predicted methyltransferase MtxX (methanogen marker protein 4)
MDDIVVRQKAKISVVEMERRRKVVRQADANNRLEGIFRDPSTDVVVDAYVRGEISAIEMLPRLRAALGPR